MADLTREPITAQMLGHEIGAKADVQCTWSDSGIRIRDDNNRTFMSIDEYLGRLCAFADTEYTSLSSSQRELFAFVLGATIETVQEFIVPHVVGRNNG